MAELALAIIPIGLKTCSGLVSYLSSVKDRDDALARVVRQAKSLEGSFQLLDGFLKRGQLDPATSQVVDHALQCLRSCDDGLKGLEELQQKLSSSVTPDQKAKDKIKDGYRKLSYPLQQSQLKQLESTLNNLCTPLNLAIQNLQLELQQLAFQNLDRNTMGIQQTNNEVSNISTAIVSLNSPISNIQSQFPVIQHSVDALVPQINLMIQAQFRTQMEEIKLSFQAAESAAVSQRHAQTNELLSKLSINKRNHAPAIYELVSKPSALAAVANSVSACQCRARQLRTRRSVKFGPIYIVDEMVPNIRHYKDCNFHIGDPNYSRNMVIRFTGFTGLISQAIDITFRTSKGAGTFGISPSITYFVMVDRETAPAFQVIRLLMNLSRDISDPAHQELLLRKTIQKLQRAFRSGRARPTDVDEGGNSLLHQLIYEANFVLSWDRDSSWNTTLALNIQVLVQFLITIGAPKESVNSSNSLPLHQAAGGTSVPTSIIRLLLVDNADILPTREGSRIFNISGLAHQDFAICDHETPRIIEALFEPLGVAIVRSDIAAVEQLMQRYPEILSELNFNSETYFSLAMSRPEVLEIIVRRATPEQSIQRSKSIWGRMSPMGKAILMSRSICDAQRGVDETLCPCVAAVKILLNGGCPIIPARDFQLSHRHGNLFSRASKHCKFLVAAELRIRRRKLRQLAEEKLHPAEYSHLCLSEAELDYQATELDWLLRQKGVLTFGRLSSAGHSSEMIDTPYGSSVYVNLDEPEDASIFWNLGFSDINNYSGTWLSDDNSMKFEYLIHSWGFPPEYSIWLAAHCPRLWELICHHSKPEGPDHVLANKIGRTIFNTNGHEEADLLKFIIDNLSKVVVVDSCTCQCSPEGCTPFDLVMKWLVHDTSRRSSLSLFLTDNSKALDLDRHIVMIRQATFRALDMIHTCVDRPDPYHISYNNDDDEEEDVTINAEDLEKARSLDNVVTEFRDFVLRESEVVDCETSDTSASGKEQPGKQGTVNHQRIIEFWNEVWPSRVREIREELAATWSPDQKVLGDLGVSLWYEEEVDDDLPSETWKERRAREIEDLWRELEMI